MFYAIESLVNSRIYIGQTQDIDRRIAAIIQVLSNQPGKIDLGD
jgi:GIY-YIG catalytic domain